MEMASEVGSSNTALAGTMDSRITTPNTVQAEVRGQETTREDEDVDAKLAREDEEVDPKTGLKRLLRNDKKTGISNEQSITDNNTLHRTPLVEELAASADSSPAARRPPSDLKSQSQPIPVSPRSPYHSLPLAASPGLLRSHSPRLHSPADSEIFERNVQEPVALTSLTSDGPAHIPAHVMTEDFIPPALEASAQAITSEELGPDEVEIVTSTLHQPAVASVLESSLSLSLAETGHSSLLSSGRHERFPDDSDSVLVDHSSGTPSHLTTLTSPPTNLTATLSTGEGDDGASSYGQLDPNDVRRLSFISFADIVQSEHSNFGVDGASQTSLPHASFGSIGGGGGGSIDRTASPMRSPRSPRSPHGITTPPLPAVSVNLAAATTASPITPTISGASGGNASGSVGGGMSGNTVGGSGITSSADYSLGRSLGVGSVTGQQHGELTIETMRQAVRKTASGDLSGFRSTGMSPI